ncbi:MAG: poly-gamma-glutamate biosynthesis protein PgsC [Lachnospiraceae bacterium]|nr:poly-gamma-glutamate biosynthesis protein PgsC [Lachnospiraceae bacterium]
MYGEVIITGIIVSIVFSYFTSLSPAGLIVPGYIALNIGSPIKILLTFAVAFITLGIYKIISRFTILYGQRRFALLVIISICVSWLVTLLPLPVANVSVIGYLIPGIIAKDCERQGILKTVLSLAAAAGITVLICLLLGAKLL